VLKDRVPNGASISRRLEGAVEISNKYMGVQYGSSEPFEPESALTKTSIKSSPTGIAISIKAPATIAIWLKMRFQVGGCENDFGGNLKSESTDATLTSKDFDTRFDGLIWESVSVALSTEFVMINGRGRGL
jgi:hypothetical protein